jgi:hypothetical protein
MGSNLTNRATNGRCASLRALIRRPISLDVGRCGIATAERPLRGQRCRRADKTPKGCPQPRCRSCTELEEGSRPQDGNFPRRHAGIRLYEVIPHKSRKDHLVASARTPGHTDSMVDLRPAPMRSVYGLILRAPETHRHPHQHPVPLSTTASSNRQLIMYASPYPA